MDYFFVLLRLSPDKHESIMDTFLQLGVRRFVAALMYVQQKIFGLEDRCLLCEPNINDGKYLLNEILEGGNFGNFNKRSKKRKHKLFFYSFLIRIVRICRVYDLLLWNGSLVHFGGYTIFYGEN